MVSVTGFVVENKMYGGLPNASEPAPSVANPNPQGDGFLPGWTRVKVRDNTGAVYAFNLPLEPSQKLWNYRLLRIQGRWFERSEVWDIVATGYEAESVNPGYQHRRMTPNGKWSLSCFSCDAQVGTTKDWGFDPESHVECVECRLRRIT